MAASDDDLLSRATQGDHDALVDLLEKHGASIRNGLSRKIPRRWRSLISEDDVMQQTFTDAFLDISQFVPQGEGSFAAWLATLANRNLLDSIRMLNADKRGGNRLRIEPASSDESFVMLYELVGAISATPSRNVAKMEAKAAIEQATQQLPETHRKVVEMYDLEGRPIGEVAKALQRSEGAVFMLRARAHRRLAEILGAASRFLSGSA